MLVVCCVASARSNNLSEYAIKAGFIYNFASFTEWPTEVGDILNLCVFGEDVFAGKLGNLQGKTVGDRHLNVRHENNLCRLEDCHILFITRSASVNLPQVLNQVNKKPVLTVADTPGATRRGVMLNMNMKESRVTFEANLSAVRDSGLMLSSRLLRLATKVIH